MLSKPRELTLRLSVRGSDGCRTHCLLAAMSTRKNEANGDAPSFDMPWKVDSLTLVRECADGKRLERNIPQSRITMGWREDLSEQAARVAALRMGYRLTGDR